MPFTTEEIKQALIASTQAIKDGAKETSKVILPMWMGTVLAKKAATENLLFQTSCVRVYQGGSYNALISLPPLMLQQGVRVMGKSINLTFTLPYVKENYPGWEKVVTPIALTGMDMFLTPLETVLTRLSKGQALPAKFSGYYAGAVAQGFRHGPIWAGYLAIKGGVDSVFNQFGFQTNTNTGALITSPVIGGILASATNPFYVLEARQQVAQAVEQLDPQKIPIKTNARFQFFKTQTTLVQTVLEKEGAVAFMRGLPPHALIVSCLAYVANRLVLLGEEKKKVADASSSSAPIP
ncbi:MAG: hypothetical protein K0U37_02485 [Gammaproteobacteria bacterium]|nr:hypothetical protein [Gammaproteobacteria bacterium]